MKFQKHVPKEDREILREQLKQYEKETEMTPEEREELHEWVASGRSPYTNGDYICYDGGYPVDFVSALRTLKDIMGAGPEEEDDEAFQQFKALYNQDAKPYNFQVGEEDEDLPFS